MNTRRSLCVGVFVLVAFVLVAAVSGAATAQAPLTETEALGKAIFFDQNLSLNRNQSCATCHAPEAGWIGPDSAINAFGAVYEGSVLGQFGDRKPPSAAYATQSPVLFVDKAGTFTGGNFWDGRATGEILGSPAAEQAKGPFLNPVEQALPDAATLVNLVCTAPYGEKFKQIWGATICDGGNVAQAYDAIGYTVAAYEASPEVNAFSSKFDASFGGDARLTQQERKGMALFMGKGKCAACHTLRGPGSLFTDYTYDNLGLPKNPENPVYSSNPAFVDPGLGGFLANRADYAAYVDANLGKHKVPTLRNVGLGLPDIVKAYGHNGYFKTLEGIVHFYNTRDVKDVCPGDYTESQALAANCWPAPEVAANLNTAELGNLGLSPDEEQAIVAFLKTLSDGYMVSVRAASAEEGNSLFLPAVVAGREP
jgi:cytochrome c peroxidase